MSVGYLELFIEQGDDFSANIDFVLDNNATYNLATYSANSSIRKSHWSANTTANFTTEILDNGVNGIIQISINSSVTQNIAAGRYVYDVFLTEGVSDMRSKVLEGILFIEPSVTRI